MIYHVLKKVVNYYSSSLRKKYLQLYVHMLSTWNIFLTHPIGKMYIKHSLVAAYTMGNGKRTDWIFSFFFLCDGESLRHGIWIYTSSSIHWRAFSSVETILQSCFFVKRFDVLTKFVRQNDKLYYYNDQHNSKYFLIIQTAAATVWTDLPRAFATFACRKIWANDIILLFLAILFRKIK